jgi:hypothetical protein
VDKALNHNNDQVGTHFPALTGDHPSPLTINPLTEPLPIWYEFYKRLKLFPWWIRYNIGLAHEAVLRDKIINLGSTMGLQDKFFRE